MKVTKKQIERAETRRKVTSRGGGIEIDLSYFGYPDGALMSAYQNYLGGGLLGSIQNDSTVSNWMNDNKLVSIALELSKYFHSLTNPDTEWESASFDELQRRPSSAY